MTVKGVNQLNFCVLVDDVLIIEELSHSKRKTKFPVVSDKKYLTRVFFAYKSLSSFL